MHFYCLLFIICTKNAYIYIYIYILQYYITTVPTCFGASAPSSRSLNIAFRSYKILKLLKLHKAVGRCMVKFVLLIKCGSGCIYNSKVCNEFIKFVHSYTSIIRLYINSLQTEDGAEAPKYVGAFVINE